MNPQYLPPQQFGDAPPNFQNPGRNNQNFQNVPLAPPTKNGPPQLNNALGKLPTRNLGQFTPLPPGNHIQELGNQDTPLIGNLPLPPLPQMNSISLDAPKITNPLVQKASFQNGANTTLSNHPAQLPIDAISSIKPPPLQDNTTKPSSPFTLPPTQGTPPTQTHFVPPPTQQPQAKSQPPQQQNNFGPPPLTAQQNNYGPLKNTTLQNNFVPHQPSPNLFAPPQQQQNNFPPPQQQQNNFPPPQQHMPPPQQQPPQNTFAIPQQQNNVPPAPQVGYPVVAPLPNSPLQPPIQDPSKPPVNSNQPPRGLQPRRVNYNETLPSPPHPGPGYNQENNQHPQGPPPPTLNAQGPLPPFGGNPSNLNKQFQNMNLAGPNQYQAPKQPPLNQPTGNRGPFPPMPNQQEIQTGFPPQPGYKPPQPVGYPPQPGFPQQQPGYPQPQPGYPQQQPGYPQAPGFPQQPGYQQQQQQKRLDPDQMPSPIQVITDDQDSRSGVFVTNQKGLVPPLVTTNFVVQDQGNASPRYIRSTMYNVPISNDIMKQTAVPFSLVVSPMAKIVPGEYPPPVVNFGELGPVRCNRCKAYMCPFMHFVDSGRRFQCAFCKGTTDVPTEYFQHLDHTGHRMDRYERPELVLGTYEFVATAEYCRQNVLPNPPAFIFVIDVSYNSVKSGLLNLLCSEMKNILSNLPIDQGQEKSNMKIGFITFNSSVHFYNIKGSLAAPQMLVVGDTNEMFMPLLEGFLSTIEESSSIIDSLMEQIPTMFGSTKETETALLPAILAGVEALKATECAGKLLVFNSNLPTADGPGKLKNRDDRKLLGTDKERTILTPQTQAYNQLGQDCVQAGCSVDLFLFNNSYIDVATIGQVARLSGGEVFKYTYFQADIDGDRLINDIVTDVGKPIAFDAIMRVRTSTGVRPTDFYGHFFMTNTTDIELASIDCNKAVALEIKHDDKLQEDEGVYVQSALLYTSCSGQRRLRISNLSLKTSSQMADLYKHCDLDTIINYISKQAMFKMMDNNPKAVKDAIITRAAQILATYRKNCASPSSAGQLILPECMKLLPLYVNCLLKSDALSGGSEMTVDERSFVMQAVMTMDVPTSVHYFYPRLLPLHDIDVNEENVFPHLLRCSIEKLSTQGVYILENGIYMFLWVGLGANPEFIQKVFGVPSAVQINIEESRLPELDNPLSLAVRNIIRQIRVERHRNMRLTFVRQKEKLEPVFKHFLVEDRGADASPSYVDFLCHMHKEIRNLLS